MNIMKASWREARRSAGVLPVLGKPLRIFSLGNTIAVIFIYGNRGEESGGKGKVACDLRQAGIGQG